MDDELVVADVLALAALGDEDLSQGGRLLAGQEPADDVLQTCLGPVASSSGLRYTGLP